MFEIMRNLYEPATVVSGQHETEAVPNVRDRRIGDIEVLRGIAVIFVLVEHVRINLFTWIFGPETVFYSYFGFWNGVDLFFAISGFVIARSLLPRLEQAQDSVSFFNETLAFWVRRVYRLLPSAWLWLAIIMILVVFFNRSGAFGPFRANLEGVVAAMLDVANVRTVVLFRHAPLGASFPYWSLSLEEQFYLALPFLVFFLRRRLVILLAASAVLLFFVPRAGEELGLVGGILNQFRSDAISFGVLIAFWTRHPTYRLFEPTALRRRPVLGVAVLLLLVLLLAAIGAPSFHILWCDMGLVAVLSAALVFVASYDQDYLLPPGLVKRVLTWVGARSYAIYLIHIPVYLLTREIWFHLEPADTVFDATYTLPFSVTATILILVLADLNYRLVEVPLRRRGARIADRLSERTRLRSAGIRAAQI